MSIIGRLTTLACLAALGLAAVVGVKSIPDIKRYLRIREM
jgi:hypothetical protein